jgi:hypothetical protein
VGETAAAQYRRATVANRACEVRRPARLSRQESTMRIPTVPRVSLAVMTIGVLVLALGSPVAAAAPRGVEIVSHMTFNPDGFNYGTFEATGPAVDGGLVCASGTVDDTRIIFVGFQSNRSAQIPVRKTFTCDDGSGTFFVKIQVHLEFATSTEFFSWVVLGGTGDYADLSGAGSGTTVSDGSDPQTGNFNNYEGILIH